MVVLQQLFTLIQTILSKWLHDSEVVEVGIYIYILLLLLLYMWNLSLVCHVVLCRRPCAGCSINQFVPSSTILDPWWLNFVTCWGRFTPRTHKPLRWTLLVRCRAVLYRTHRTPNPSTSVAKALQMSCFLPQMVHIFAGEGQHVTHIQRLSVVLTLATLAFYQRGDVEKQKQKKIATSRWDVIRGSKGINLCRRRAGSSRYRRVVYAPSRSG